MRKWILFKLNFIFAISVKRAVIVGGVVPATSRLLVQSRRHTWLLFYGHPYAFFTSNQAFLVCFIPTMWLCRANLTSLQIFFWVFYIALLWKLIKFHDSFLLCKIVSGVFLLLQLIVVLEQQKRYSSGSFFDSNMNLFWSKCVVYFILKWKKLYIWLKIKGIRGQNFIW